MISVAVHLTSRQSSRPVLKLASFQVHCRTPYVRCVPDLFTSVHCIVFAGDERVFQMQEWYIKRLDGPGAGWQGEGRHGEGGDDGDWSR